MGVFDFIPAHLRQGPWSSVAIASLGAIIYTLSSEAKKMQENGGFLRYFEASRNDEYTPFDTEWVFTLICFSWMIYICLYTYAYSPNGKAAWATFTLWSWTILTIRHGLGLLAPFMPSLRLPLEILRFPALLSATLVCFLWNFVLFPFIFFFVKDEERRSKFFEYVTSFLLTQLHVCNIFIAAANCVFVGPKRALHNGDIAAAFVLLVMYMLWYYCVLDRIGVHLYPIFSPRTPLVVFSYALFFGLCYGGFQGWQRVLTVV